MNKTALWALIVYLISIPVIMLIIFFIHANTPRFGRTLPSLLQEDFVLTNTERTPSHSRPGAVRVTDYYSNPWASFRVHYYEGDTEITFEFEDFEIIFDGIFVRIGHDSWVHAQTTIHSLMPTPAAAFASTILHAVENDRLNTYWRNVAISSAFFTAGLFIVLAFLPPQRYSL
jgi:hypothetical protein